MVKYITIGKINKNYFLLLGSVLLRLLLVFISGYKPSLKDHPRIYLFNHQPFFANHPLFIKCLEHASYILIGFILEFVYYRNNNKISNDKPDKSDERLENFRDSIDFEYDNNNIYEDRISDMNDKKNIGKIFLVIFFCFFSKFIKDLLHKNGFVPLKFWPLEFIFLIIFSKKILHKILYKHQKLAIISLIVFCTIITIAISFLPVSIDVKSQDSDPNIYDRIFDLSNSSSIWVLIPIIIVFYLGEMVMNAYSAVSFKWLIDIQYITITRIIMYISVIGFLISFPLFFGFSHIPCNKDPKDVTEELMHLCPFNNSNDSNVSNVAYFYESYKNLTRIEKDAIFYIDIFIVLILYLGASFLNIFFSFMIVKNLDPFHLLPIDSLFYLITEIIDYSITRANLTENKPQVHLKFALRLINNFASVTLSLIYYEIIELHFCGLDQHLRKYILRREDLDKKILMYNVNDEDDDDDDNDNQ